ncbi:uncharacterized protein LOC125502522, partial [Dendroctonus ponderosae]|uniref:uncharacterized protein LOC125502522 n=1 Tax=Dendroctonus ponderosae TaxID=77166 RepID=UPI0020354E3B
MNPGSSQESESDYASQDGGFKKPQSKKRGRKTKTTQPTQPTPTTPTTPTPEAKRIALDYQSTTNKNQTTNSKTTSTRFPTYSHTFTANALSTITRVQLAIRWEELNPNNKDVIIRQDNYFLIKTNQEDKTSKILQQLKQENAVTSCKLQKNDNLPRIRQQKSGHHHITPSYSVVATGVDLDIEDSMFLERLEQQGFKIRFCRRIISRERNAPTLMMRLITGDISTYERLMSDRAVHFLGRIFKITESKPPAPVPAPCGKCNLFSHKTEDCKQAPRCNKCQGPHPTSRCESPLPTKCAACNSEDHAAWSMKC